MKRIVFILITVLLASFSSFADDVVIDENGNVETGVSSPLGGGNLDVTGTSGQHAIFGSASGTGSAGVYGIRSDNSNYGILGYDNVGVYGNSTSGFAGYFQGDVHVTGNFTLDGALSGEADPVFSVWDKSSGISITESQITDLNHFTTLDETDPQVGAISLNFVPKWDGSSLISSSIFDDGNVGIGTAAPGYKLEVVSPLYQTLKLTTAHANSTVRLTGAATGIGGFFIDANGGNNYLAVMTGGVEKMRINSAGYVGIGTTSPDVNLDIFSSSDTYIEISSPGGTFSNGIVFTHGNRDWLVGNRFSDSFNFYHYALGYDVLTLSEATGNVGIGTTSPSEKLTVAGTIESTSGGIKFPDATIQTSASLKYVRTVIVSPVPGDALASGTALLNALAGITDASATNPYLLKIEPGVYDLGNNGLTMQPYVDIEGSGENVTTITSTHSSTVNDETSATVIGASDAELRFLTVENQGGSDISIAIYSYFFVSPDLTNITASASGGANFNYGIRNDSSSPKMSHVTASAIGGVGSALNAGVSNTGYSSSMTDVTASASGGNNSAGIWQFSSYGGIMTNVTASASGGTDNYGMYNISSTFVRMKSSSFSGATNSILNTGGAGTWIASTMLDGAVAGGGFKCVGAFDENYAALDSACQPIP